MAGWVWIVVAVVVLTILVSVAVGLMRRRRSTQLREGFGPEYDHAVSEHGGRSEAEADLIARRKRREQLDIRPLEPAARQRYLEQWQVVQARFVDDPSGAQSQADTLVLEVMRARGYPTDDFEQRAADISVDHPRVVEHYRAAHGISVAAIHGQASTEDMRQAVVHYRALFEELLGDEAHQQREAQ
jgi:hypothetical protein